MKSPDTQPVLRTANTTKATQLFNRLKDHPGYKTPDNLPDGVDPAEPLEALELKAGFTIGNLGDLLPKPASDPAADPEVIGWVFILPDPTGGINPAMTEIRIEEVSIGPDPTSGAIRVDNRSLPATIEPKIIGKVPVKTLSPPTDYLGAHNLLLPFYHDDRGLPIQLLEAYRDWAELCFLSRTDLDLMSLVLAEKSDYNQFFFSGAEAHYQSLHNPLLRLRSDNFSSSRTAVQPDSTVPAFTLKVEPVVEDAIGQLTTGTGDSGLEGDVGSLPLVGLMAPCPELWHYESGIEKSLMRVIPGAGAEERALIRNLMASEAFVAGDLNDPYVVPDSDFAAAAGIPPGRDSDFFDRLRDLWNRILDFLGL